MPNHCQVSKFAELDGGGVFSGKKKVLQRCKSNRKFYWGENRKWHILQGWKTLLTQKKTFIVVLTMQYYM